MANEKRLICANALTEQLNEYIQENREVNCCANNFAADVCEVLKDDYVKEAPTVDAVPVVHGRWEKYQRYVICSNCDTGWPYYKNDTDRFRYCPNCGAKMDGDGNG